MDGERRKAILTWLNCLQVGSEITELTQLIDGFHVTEILKIIWSSNKNRTFLKHDDWITSLQAFLEDFYRTHVTDVVGFEQIVKGNEFEIAKAMILLLSATVHFETDRRFVDLPTCLDSKVQHQIKQIIEGVLLDGEQPLNRNFAEILVSTDMYSCLIYETTSPRKSSGDDPNRSFGESGESKTISPIQQLLQSPLIVNKLKLRDKDRRIHRLEAELDAERMMRVDNEAELQKMGLLIEMREKALKRAEIELRKFQMQYEDTKTLYDEASVQLERLTLKSEKCESLMEECKQLRSELEAVIDDKLALQEENDELSMAYQSATERLSESQSFERKLCEVQVLLEDRDSLILALKSEQQVLFAEFRQMRQIYEEKTAILEKALKKKPETNGEPMTVVTEMCLRELQILHHQLKDQYDVFKQSSESAVTKLVTEKTSLEAIIEEKGRKIIVLQEKRARLLEELNKQNAQVSELAVKISKLEDNVEEMLTHKLQLEKDIESKDVTAAELKTEWELKTLEFRNYEEQMLSDLNETKSELASYVEKCQTLEVEIKRLDVELDELRSEMAEKTLKWESQVQLMATEKETLEKELEARNEDTKRLVVELALKGDLMVKLEDQIKTEKIAFEQMVVQHEETVKWLEGQLSQLKKELSDREVELQRLEVVRNDEKSSHEAQLNECTNDILRLCKVVLLKDGTIESLDQQVSHEKVSSEQMIVAHNSTVEKLRAEVDETCCQLTNKQKQLELVEGQLKEFVEDVRKLNEVVTEKDGKIESMSQQMSEEKFCSDQLIAELQFDIERLKREVGEIGCRLKEKVESLRMSEAKLQECTNDILNLQEVVLKKDNMVENLNGEISRKKASKALMIAEYDSKIERLRSEVEEIGCHLKETEATLQTAETHLKECTGEISKLHEAVSEKDCKIKSLDQQMLQMVTKHNYDIEKLRAVVEDIKCRLTKKEEELQVVEERLKESTDDVAKLQEVSLQKERTIESLNQQISREKSYSEQVIAEHKSKIQRLQSEVEDVNCQMKEKEETLLMVETQLKESSESILKLRGVVSAKDSVIETLDQQISSERASSHQLIEEHNTEIQQLRAETEEIESRLVGKEEQLQNFVKEIEVERALINAELCSRENDLKLSKMESVRVQHDLEELQGKMILEQNSLLETLEIERSATLKLKEQLEVLEATVREKVELLNTVSKKSEDERLSMEVDMQTRDEELEKLHADVLQKDASVSEIQQKLIEEQEKFEKLEMNAKLSIETLKKELDGTVRDLKKLRAEVIDKDEVTKMLEKSISSLEENLQKMESDKLYLESQRNDLNEKILELEIEVQEKETLATEVEARMTQESIELKGNVNEKQSTIDELQEQNVELRNRVQEKEEVEVICNNVKSSLEAELESFKMLKVELDEKNREMKEERDKLSHRLEALQRIIDEQQDMIKRLEENKMKELECDSSTKQTTEGIELSILKASNVLEVEKIRRRSVEVESRLNYSDLRDVSLCRSFAVNGAFMDSRRFDLDVQEEAEDTVNNQLDYSQELNMEDSLEEIRPRSRLSNVSLLPSDEKIDQRRKSLSEIALLTNMQHHCENLQKENKTLYGETHSLQNKIQELQRKLDDQKSAVKLQSDLPQIIQRLKEQVFESENKNAVALKMVKVEYESMKKQCEATKKTTQDLKNVVMEKEILLGEQNKQLEHYKMYCDSKKQQLSEAVAMYKNEKEMARFLKAKLHEEEKKCAPYVEKIREQEMTLQRHIQEKRSIETQLNLASQKLREFQKGSVEFGREELQHQTWASSRTSSHTMLGRKTSSSLNSLTKTATSMRESVSDGQLAFEDLLSQMNESTEDIDSKIWTAGNVSTASAYRAVPAGAGNYFKCEDEEGEFLNFSYLDDLKRGKCNVDNHLGRISELQRRNTLCLPHLKTSYPVEMQMQSTQKFTDNDLKAGAAVEDNLFAKHEATDANMATRKSKPIQPSYQKPGPPTPGKSGKQGTSMAATEKPIKTPSSIKKLFQRSVFGTPKRGNRENVPPEKSKVSRARKNIAFQVGFSPKVKSVSKQQPLNNRVEQRRQPN